MPRFRIDPGDRSRGRTFLLAVAAVALAFAAGGLTGHFFWGDGPDQSAPPPATTTAPSPAARLTSIVGTDRQGRHERTPRGVPTAYDWATGPVERPVPAAGRYAAFTGWGQVYGCAGTPLDPDVAVQIRDMQVWMFTDGRWRKVQDSSVLSGAAYPEDFQGATGKANVLRRESGGTVVALTPARNFHFWPEGPRVALRGVPQAIVVLAQARLVSERSGCVLVGMGGDYWRDLTSASDGFTNSRDAGIGRLKVVDRQWRVASMSTVGPEFLRRHPLRAPGYADVAR